MAAPLLVSSRCAFFVLVACSAALAAPATDDGSKILHVIAFGKVGQASNITCVISSLDLDVQWKHRGVVLNTSDTRYKVEKLTERYGNTSYYQIALLLSETLTSDYGNYSCFVSDDPSQEKETLLDLRFPTKIVQYTNSPVYVKISEIVYLNCIFEGFNLTEVKWRQLKNMSVRFEPINIHSSRINETFINGTLKITDISRKDNGTYYCGIIDDATSNRVIQPIDILVLDKPQVSLDYIKAVGATKIFLNWTVNDGNSPIESYNLQYRKNGTDEWTFYQTRISGENVSFIMIGLDPSTSYQLRIDAKNSEGTGQTYTDHRWIKTLAVDPRFIPNIVIKGFTYSTVTIGWNPPPDDLVEYVHYYDLIAREKDTAITTEKEAIHSANYKNLPYMFDNLAPATTYIFQVRACSELTNECGEWSLPVNCSTMDDIAGPPLITSYACHYENISGTNFIYVTWQPPVKPNGKIIRYDLEISGEASYINSDGALESTTWGPKIRHVMASTNAGRFDSMPANTNFTIKVSAVTRTKRPGEAVFVHCSTPPSTPPRDSLQNVKWIKIRENDGRWMFKLYIPRVTERNGAICCYRIFLVKMKNNQKLCDMPSPEHLAISTYKEVHNGKQSAGAYLAEIFTSNTLESDVILGDGVTFGAYSAEMMEQCERCASILPRKFIKIVTTLHSNSVYSSTFSPSDLLADFKLPSNIDGNVLNEANSKQSGGNNDNDNNNINPLVTNIPLGNEEIVPVLPNKNMSEKMHAKKKRLYSAYKNTSINKNAKKHQSADYSENNGITLDGLSNDQKTTLYIGYNKSGKTFDGNSGSSITDMLKDDSSDVDQNILKNGLSINGNKNLKYVDGHKIVLRQINEKSLEAIKNSSLTRTQEYDNTENFNKKSFNGVNVDEAIKGTDEKNSSTKLVEEIVDINNLEQKEIGENNEKMVIFDGQLDNESNYTGFLELIVHSEDSGRMIPMYSDYFTVLKPGPSSSSFTDDDMEIFSKIAISCMVLLVIIIIFCIFYERTRRTARHQGVEMNTIHSTLRNLYQGLKGGRHQLVVHTPPNMPPVCKENLLSAYTERQANSGYGFQHEFELLPDCFPDRTMDASEAKENQSKNRYPDIKAYDQTRVKLSLVDSVVGSDYINANIVMGYKERKKFVCAQGPTDVTVDDFWRMVWEYNLDLIVMLTNLEEYSKVKCSKYWPDQNQADKVFNNINVHHVNEKRYSDYIIRELKITKQALPNSNSSNQIVEVNGIAKRNGDCNNILPNSIDVNEERIVNQYHFLMWKDFVAPEYPHAILKFIKRVNEASSAGRPILVHCSAGVGRTGTLVALDCLLQQLSSENEVAIFNTICDLRRQRNFLVQSLKQYTFVYRALVEFAQYGDTEIPASRLKSTVDRLRQTVENSDTCAMEVEFEKLKQPILETTRLCSAGRAPENLAKNRSETIVPYDHNRVILAPIPTKDNSTYINASFIEGYDNSESYIITQDPLPSTISDFWRMVSEQEITTIIMLSELGEGKCPRYWDDDEIQYDHIYVTYLLSESCPYYTKRQFQVTNAKNHDRVQVTQYQYHGWPTVSGQVPEVTRGIIELIGQSGISCPSGPPVLVHCSLGTDRSSMFVALSILTIQLRIEHRVDISTVTRKLRNQRMGCLDTYLQYEFLHRAIINYAELHNLLTDS